MNPKEIHKKVQKLGGVVSGEWAYFTFGSEVNEWMNKPVELSDAKHIEHHMICLGYELNHSGGCHMVFKLSKDNGKPVEGLYAGRLCPRCKKGLNRELRMGGHDEMSERQKKRYGSYVCNSCLIELVEKK